MTTRMIGLALSLALVFGCYSRANDAELALAVEQKLRVDMGFSDVKTESESGKVTLSGSVGSALDRSRAEVLAGGVEGVAIVSNQLTVITPRISLPAVASPPPSDIQTPPSAAP